MIETLGDDGQPQAAWRPKNVYHYIQDRQLPPAFVVDITPYWDKKWEAIQAFKTQFFNPDLDEPADLPFQPGLWPVYGSAGAGVRPHHWGGVWRRLHRGAAGGRARGERPAIRLLPVRQ